MAQVADHLSVAELLAGYRGSGDATLARHFQTIWLLAQGRTVAETARLTSFAPRWVEQLLARYNAFGPSSLGDRRRGNGAEPKLLTPALLARLRERVRRPPDDGGVWTARKVAAFMAGELGLAPAAMQRGWEALRAIGWTIQKPGRGTSGWQRPRRRRRSKTARRGRRRGAGPHPGAVIETFATDEHRIDRARSPGDIGLKPILRRVWAPRGERPIAPCHHRL